MLATGSPTVSADTVGQRIGDKGSKEEPKSPARSFFGSVSLQTLSKHLTRRGSSNKLTAIAAAPSNGTTSPAVVPAAAAAPGAADAQAAVEPSAAAAECTPGGDTPTATSEAAPAAPVSAFGSSAADAHQEQQQPASVEPTAGPQLQASPVVVMTDAAVAAGAAADAGSFAQTGKRKASCLD